MADFDSLVDNDCSHSEVWQRGGFAFPGSGGFKLKPIAFGFLQLLPWVTRIFVPAVKFPSCEYLNDENFLSAVRLCKTTGQGVAHWSPSGADPFGDLYHIDERAETLKRRLINTPYNWQKTALEREFVVF